MENKTALQILVKRIDYRKPKDKRLTQKMIIEAMQEYSDQSLAEAQKTIEGLRNDLLDALDLKEGKGPTALSILQSQISTSNERIARLEEGISETINRSLKSGNIHAGIIIKELKSLLK